MQTYPVDIDPEEVVRWIVAEQATAPSTFRIVAWRVTEAREIPLRKEFHLGDEEREDLSEIVTIATLEIAPARAADGWLLRITVEDEVGPHVPERDATFRPEQQIDLGTFFKHFIRRGRGIANVTAEVENSAAEARLTALLSAIEKRPPLRRSQADI